MMQMMMGGGGPRPRGRRGAPFQREYYDLMGVPCNATAKELKKAYRKKAIIMHPDKGGTDAQFKKLNKVNNILKDEESRMCYDAFGSEFEKENGIDMYKMSIRSRDTVVKLGVSLKDVINGKTFKVTIPRNGRPDEVFEVKLTPPIPPNHVIVHEGKGTVEPGKLPGHLTFMVVDKPDPNFSRKGNCLISKVKIDLGAMVSGGPVPIKHPDDSVYSVESEQGFDTDQWYCVPGAGITVESDLFVQFDPIYPAKLDADTRRKVAVLLGFTPEKKTNTMSVTKVRPEQVSRKIQATAPDEANHRGGGRQRQQGPECKQM